MSAEREKNSRPERRILALFGIRGGVLGVVVVVSVVGGCCSCCCC